MIRLYILRHGIAVPHVAPGMDDDDRPLTPEGEKKVKQVARGLRKLELTLERIITSPVARARRTAEITAEVLDLSDKLEDSDSLRPGRDAVSIREWLRTRDEASLMIVGHNPSLSDLVGLLISGQPGAVSIDLRKGGIAALTATSGPTMSLEWLARPRLLRTGDD